MTVNYTGEGTVVGTYDIKATFTVNTDLYYPIDELEATLTITPATIKNVTVTGYNAMLDNNAHDRVVSKNATTVDNSETTWLFSKNQEDWFTQMTVTDPEDSGTYYFKINADNHDEYIGHFEVVVTEKNVTTIEITNLSSLNKVYDGTRITSPIIYTNNGLGTVTITYSLDGTTFTDVMPINAGHYTIKVEVSETDTYAKASIQKTFDISKATYDMSGVIFEGFTTVYDGGSFSVVVYGTLPAGVTVTYEGNGQTNVGTYTVVAKFSGDYENYNEIDDMTTTFEIIKATYNMSGVEFNDDTVTYDGNVHSLAISGTLPEGVTVSYDNNDKVNAGTYEVTAVFNGDYTNYNVILDKFATLKINKATYDMSGVAFNDSTIPYDGLSHKLTISGTLPIGVSVTYSDTASYTAVGEYEYTASFSGDEANYELIDSMTATLTIEKATIDTSVVVFSDLTVTYDGLSKSITATNIPDHVSVEYTENGKTNAGTYTVTVTFIYDNDCYNVTVASKTATLTINKKEIDTSVVVFSDLTVTYDKTNKSILATNVPTNITVEYTGNGKKNAGTYTVTATFVYDTDNYTVTVASKTATLTIEKATINMSEVTFNNGTFTYDGNVKSIAVSDNLPEEITGVTYTNNNKVNAGIYTVTASFEYDTDNYNTVSDMTATLTINKKEIDNSNIDLPDATYTYDGSVKSLAYTGVLPSGISGVNYTGNNQTNAGIYDVVMTFNYDTTNYTVTVLQLYGTLTIEKATINMSGVTFNNGSFTYDGSAKSIYVSSNLPEEITNVNYTNNGQVNAGTYTVTASFVYDTDNYNEVSNITATLTINKATIDTSVVVFNNLTVDYDGTSKSITATNFPTGVTATYTGNGKINAGTYTVTATFVYDNDNYEVTVASKTATLKINKINPTYTVPTNLKACVGSTLASVTLPAGFTWNDPTTTSVGAVGNNNFTVTYTPDDTTNYNVIDDIVVTIAVQEKYVIICENNQSSDYSATQQGPVVTVKLNNIVVTENYTLSYAYKLTSASTYTNGLPTNAGEYNIKINCSGTEGYNADEVIVNFKIKKVKLTITSPNIALNYSSSARTWASIAEAIKPLITYSGLLAGDETTTTVLGMHNGKYKYGSVSGSYIAPTSDTIFGSSYTNVIGSTYSVFVSQSNENYELNEYTIVLKYKTALIGSTYYTIEDAISATGTITFAGDSSAAQTYVATTFSSLDTSITGYSTSYTLSNRTLFIPYTNNTSINNKPTNAGSGNAQGNVYTSLIVPEHITINMNNSSNLVIDANVLYSQSYSSTWSNIRGVIVNDGIINLSSSKLYAYGYLKGNGTLNLTNNSSAIDLLDLFDFSGGTIASDIYTKCLPFTAWTLNNISCNAYYYSGSTLTGYSHAILSYVGEQTGSALIIGTTNSSNALFMPLTISNSNYIVKYASPSVTNKNSDTAALRSITGNNQKKGIKQIVEINGNYKDNTVSVSIQVTISTSTSKSLPISYLSIILKNNSVLNISQSDYLFLPGTSLTVEEGATLNVGADVDIALLPWSYFSSTYNFYNNCIDKVDPKIINNGSITFNGNVGGHITTEISGAQLNISGGVKASYTMYYTTGEGDHYEIKNSSTTLYLYNGIANENQLKTLSNGSSFYSIKDDNNVYGFYATSGTISYITNGGKESYSPKNIAIGKNGYTITNSDLPQNPTRDYYTFEGWYIDNSFNTLALGYKIYSGIELYAKWNLIDYTINYIDVYNSSPSGGSYTNSNPTSFNYETNVLFIEPTNGDYVFGGWYVDELCTNRIHMLTGSSLVSYLSDNSINIYISWYSEGTSKYVITFVNTNEDITCPSYDSIIGDGYDWSSYVLPVMSQNDNNYEVPIYFGGWYMNDTLINVLNEDLFELNSTTGCYELTLTTHWKDKNCLTVKAFTFVLATVYYKSGYSFTIPSLESKGITLGQEGLVLINWQSDNGTTYNSGDIITLIDQTEINAYIVTFVKLEIGLNDYTTVTVTLTSGQGYIVNYNETTGVSTATPFTGQTKSNGSETYITTGSIFKARYTAAQDSRNNSAKITGTTPTTDLKTSDQTYTATSSDISIKPEGEESCLAPGSLITMADGTQKAVEDIKLYDLVLTWNFFTGEYQVMPVISIEKRTNVVCNLATITLENGYQIKIINSQSFFDYDTKQYFVIDLDNPDMYIGRNIAITDETGFTSSRIANITVEKTTSDTYELLTAYNLNVIADGMLTTSPYVVYYNFFEIDENNMINMDVLSQDIETYGLFTYDEWSQYISQEAFDVVMVAYLKIAIGKGYATYDDILRVCMLYLTTEAV